MILSFVWAFHSTFIHITHCTVYSPCPSPCTIFLFQYLVLFLAPSIYTQIHSTSQHLPAHICSTYRIRCARKYKFVKLLMRALCVQDIAVERMSESDLLRATFNKYFRCNLLLRCTLCLRHETIPIPSHSLIQSFQEH